MSARVEIYTTDFCGYCTRAKALLASKGVEVIEIRAGSDPEKRREMIQRSQGGMTFPQVFINGKACGGFSDISALDDRGDQADGEAARGKTRPGARRRRLQAGRKHDPGAALYLLEEAELLLEDREVDAARAALLKAVTHDPGAGAAWELLSALRRELGPQVQQFGERYRRYRAEVGMLLPRRLRS